LKGFTETCESLGGHLKGLLLGASAYFDVHGSAHRCFANQPRELKDTDYLLLVELENDIALLQTSLCGGPVRVDPANDRPPVLLIVYRHSDPSSILRHSGNRRHQEKHNEHESSH